MNLIFFMITTGIVWSHFLSSDYFSKDINTVISIFCLILLFIYVSFMISQKLPLMQANDIGNYYNDYIFRRSHLTRFNNIDIFQPGIKFVNIIFSFFPIVTKNSYAFIVSLVISSFLLFAALNIVKAKYLDLFFWFFLSFQFFSNGMINVIKQGFADVILLFTVSLFLSEKKGQNNKTFFFAVLSLIGISFHYSLFPIILIFLFRKTLKRISLKRYFQITIIFVITSLSGINKLVTANIGSFFNNNFEYYNSGSALYNHNSKMLFIVFLTICLYLFITCAKYVKNNESIAAFKSFIFPFSWAAYLFSYIDFADRLFIYPLCLLLLFSMYLLFNGQIRHRKGYTLLFGLFMIGLALATNSGSFFVPL